MFFVGEKLLCFHSLSVVPKEDGRWVETVTQGVVTMSRKMSLVEFFCQKLQLCFSLNNQKIKENKQEDKVKLRKDVEKEDKQVIKEKIGEKVRQKLVSANLFEKEFAENAIKKLEKFLDDEKNKLNDEQRAEIISIKESLEKALRVFIESIRILVKKEKYTQVDFDEISSQTVLIHDLLEEFKFFCLKRELSKEE